MVCLVVFYFLLHRPEPDIERAVDHLARPKLTRSVRKNAVRSEKAKMMIEKTDIDVGDTGMTSSRCVKDTLDEATGILRQEVDENCDGVIDVCRVKELNAYGEPIHIELYRDCGKVPTSCYEIEYNEYGEEITYHIDNDCDGNLDECITNKRNDHGDIIEVIKDKKCDGKFEEGDGHGCFSYSYDKEGMIMAGHAGNCGEKPQNCTECEYDLDAGIRREKWDIKCDGTIDFCWVKIYRDDFDEPDSFISMGCDGIWKSCSIHDDDGGSIKINKFKGHEVCANKYEELMKRNLGK